MTSTHSSTPTKLPAEDLFSHGRYRIPLYQRAYAWTASEIQTLLADIGDARRTSSENGTGQRNYYIGSLVVDSVRDDDEVVHEVVDGQQRLTTLYIVLAVAPRIFGRDPSAWLNRLSGGLTYEGRPEAGDDLRELARSGIDALDRLKTDGIRNAVEIIARAASRGAAGSKGQRDAADEPSFSSDDLDYLLKRVMLLRTELPEGTDLNHYFEVMNTRGEQLEKHEILKARLVSRLPDRVEQQSFARVWDACSVLDRHLQAQFPPTDKSGHQPRAALFGENWDSLVPRSGAELFATMGNAVDAESPDVSRPESPDLLPLSEILDGEPAASATYSDDSDADESGSYGAIIDFPNLLLHALKIQRGETFSWADDTDSDEGRVRLEDKYLLEEFGPAENYSSTQIRDFAFILLKTRYLLDTYVIRTQANTAGDHEENWVIHRAYRYKRNRDQQLSARNTFGSRGSNDTEDLESGPQHKLLLLQSMFQVTDTRRSAKYFLFQMLDWLHRQDQAQLVSAREFIAVLEKSARKRLSVLFVREDLDQGTLVQNFLFNVLDYELWLLAAEPNRARELLDEPSARTLDEVGPKFRFRFRTSVEHFYPVEPGEEHGHERLPTEVVDQFGNLCIMSRSENSRRSNMMPASKVNEFRSEQQSLKFQLMGAITTETRKGGTSGWGPDQIDAHGSAMIRVLRRAIDQSR